MTMLRENTHPRGWENIKVLKYNQYNTHTSFPLIWKNNNWSRKQLDSLFVIWKSLVLINEILPEPGLTEHWSEDLKMLE